MSFVNKWFVGHNRKSFDLARCPLPEKGNPCLPHCQNFVSPDEAAQAVAKFVVKREELRV